MYVPLVAVFLLAAAAFDTANGHRILGIFTHIGGSHFRTFYPIMSELAQRGHHVTVLSYFTVKNPPPNYHQIQLDGLEILNSSLNMVQEIVESSYYGQLLQFADLHLLGDQECRDVYKSRQLDEVLRLHADSPYDLAVVELFDSDCMLGAVHVMNIPHVGLSSCVLMPWHHDRVAMPDLPSHVPSEFGGFFERMTFEERMRSWIMNKAMKLLYKLTQRNDDAYIREKFGDGIPSVAELANRVSVLLVNQHFSYHGPRAQTPQIIEIGGIHIEKEKPIPQDLLSIIEKAEHGVIVISWGSNLKASSLPENHIQAILSAVKHLPQQIIWKWENQTLANKPPNVHVASWLPQRDILCHPNVKLFWTHGGNLGTSESVHCGTPMIITPIYGDQYVNSAALQTRGMGIQLTIAEFTQDNIYAALVEALKPIYKTNAEKTSLAFRDRPQSPLDTAVWWIEHVIKSDGFPFGRAYAVNMPWYTYHSADVICVLIGALSAFLMLFGWVVKVCCCRTRAKPTKFKSKTS